MRKIAICAFAVGVVLSADAFAQSSAPNNVGCGMGSMAWEGQSGVAPQIFAATTNGTFGTQTFGISSGTSGCGPNGKVAIPDKRTVMFISPNMNRLAQDMSRGDGETLAALAETMQIMPEDRPAFFAATQQNFEHIMPDESVTAGEVAANLYAVMGDDPVLRRYVAAS